MTKRKKPTLPVPLPKQGGSYVRNKDGTLAQGPLPGTELGAATPDASRPEPRREHRHQPEPLSKD